MKIGVLAYHYVCNFGATLQLLSTYMYLRNRGHEAVIINYVAPDLEDMYKRNSPAVQIEMQTMLRKRIWTETTLCQSDEDIARVIERERIEAVIIGSDAVAQHHPLLERIVFPCKKIVGVLKNTSNMEYPNPMWATWLDCLHKEIPVAVLSASCQDSKYKLIPKKTLNEMNSRVSRYSYLSVRDEWTRDMYSYITHGKTVPEVTPDPVFAFNQNVASICPTEKEIKARYNLPEHYILLTFHNRRGRVSVSQQWLDEFADIAAGHGKECVLLPFADGKSFGRMKREIEFPLNPIDWYTIIKYSDGYVGNNMHPIVVSLHNAVPFFSFDNYGTTRLNGILSDDNSSKIKHILSLAQLTDYRVSVLSRGFHAPDAKDVYTKLASFDKNKCKAFAEKYEKRYNNMMDDILNNFLKKS